MLCSDGRATYARIAVASGCEHRRIEIPKKDWLDKALGDNPRHEGALGLGRVNEHHRNLKTILNRQADGVSTRFLHAYLGWLRAIRRENTGPYDLLLEPLIYRYR